MAKPALGRGLGALMGGATAGPKAPVAVASGAPAEPSPVPPPVAAGEVVRRLPVARLKPCPFQPRRDFAEEPLKELADSIRAQGILQPLVARPRGDGFEIVAGERRWRAAQLAGLAEVPVLVREASDAEVLELALIENLQRENLNPLEEALGFSRLISEFRLTQEEAATRVGKSRATVSNSLRLLQLPEDIQGYLRSNLLTVGHAKAILSCSGADSQKRLADQVIREGLTVRATEALAGSGSRSDSSAKNLNGASPKPKESADLHVRDLEARLQERFGTRVQLRYRAGKGAIEIRFFTDDDLNRILEIAGLRMD